MSETLRDYIALAFDFAVPITLQQCIEWNIGN